MFQEEIFPNYRFSYRPRVNFTDGLEVKYNWFGVVSDTADKEYSELDKN